MIDHQRLSARIWKYRLHYVIVLPALLLIVVFKVIPFLTGLFLPFVDFTPFRGLSGSPWAGTNNFRTLFALPEFRQIVTNTLVLNVGYVFAASAVALLLALALASVRWAPLRSVFATLFLMPYFIPSAVFAYVIAILLSPDRSPIFRLDVMPLGDEGWFRPLVIAAETLKTVGIPALVALTAIASRHEAELGRSGDDGEPGGTVGSRPAGYLHLNVIPAVRAVVAFALVRLSMPLASDFDLMHSLVNPLVYRTGDTLATYGFRVGFINAQYSLAAAVWLLQFAVQLVFALAAYFLIRGSFAAVLFGRFERPRIKPANAGASWIGIAVAAAYGAVALLPLYVLFVVPLTARSESGVSAWSFLSIPGAIQYGFLFFAAAVVHMLMTATLAYPLTVRRLPGRGLYKLFLIFAALLGSGAIHEYFLFRSLGLVNTAFAVPLSGLVAIVPVFVLKSVFNAKYAHLKEQAEAEGRGELHAFVALFLPKVWKTWVALGVLQYTALAGAYQTSLLYLANPESFSPIMRFVSLTWGSPSAVALPGDPVVLAVGALVSLPGIALLLVFRPWLTSEALVGHIRRG